MDMIHFKCSSCGKKLKVDAAGAGKRVRCPGCGAGCAVPLPGQAGAAASRDELPELSEGEPDADGGDTGTQQERLGFTKIPGAGKKAIADWRKNRKKLLRPEAIPKGLTGSAAEGLESPRTAAGDPAVVPPDADGPDLIEGEAEGGEENDWEQGCPFYLRLLFWLYLADYSWEPGCSILGPCLHYVGIMLLGLVLLVGSAHLLLWRVHSAVTNFWWGDIPILLITVPLSWFLIQAGRGLLDGGLNVNIVLRTFGVGSFARVFIRGIVLALLLQSARLLLDLWRVHWVVMPFWWATIPWFLISVGLGLSLIRIGFWVFVTCVADRRPSDEAEKQERRRSEHFVR